MLILIGVFGPSSDFAFRTLSSGDSGGDVFDGAVDIFGGDDVDTFGGEVLDTVGGGVIGRVGGECGGVGV